MPSFLNLNQHEAAAVAAVPAGEIAMPDEETGGAAAPAASSSPPTSPTTSGAPSARSKEHRRLFLLMPTTGGNAKSTFGNGWPILTPINASGIRTIALLAFGFLAVLLCSVTISHLAIAAPSKTATIESSGQSLPSLPAQQPAHQVSAPPLSDQLDALRSSVAQLQNAIAEMQQQKSPSEPMAEAQIWAPPPNYLMNAPRMPLARRQLAWQPMKRMAWQPMKRMIQWQPVKRNSPNGGTIGGESAAGNAIDPKEQVILAIEQQLVEVLKAGEALGISAEQILAHLRTRNGDALGATFYG